MNRPLVELVDAKTAAVLFDFDMAFQHGLKADTYVFLWAHPPPM